MAPSTTKKYVTAEQFAELATMVGDLAGLVRQVVPKAPETKPIETKPVAQANSVGPAVAEEAGSDEAPINPRWVKRANEILGDAVDRCEIFYPKNGGQIFTVVIKKERSNASPDYLARHKEDRRSREIGTEGLQGVEAWCKLILQNLSKGKPLSKQEES